MILTHDMAQKKATKPPQGFSQLWPPRGPDGRPRRAKDGGHHLALGEEAAAAFDQLTGISLEAVRDSMRRSPPWPDESNVALASSRSRKPLFFARTDGRRGEVVEELAAIARVHEEAIHQLDVARVGEMDFCERVANLARFLHPTVESLVEELNLDVSDSSPLAPLLAEAGWDRVSQTYVVQRLLSLLKAAKQLAAEVPPDSPNEARPAHRPKEPFGETIVQLYELLKARACGRPRVAVALFMIGFRLLGDDLRRRIGNVDYWDYDALMTRIKTTLGEARKAK